MSAVDRDKIIAKVKKCLALAKSSNEHEAAAAFAFRVDQAGNIRVQEVLGLRRLNIEDERWQRAMGAIADAVQVVGSKSYLRVYERVDGTASYRQIPLDVSAVGTEVRDGVG